MNSPKVQLILMLTAIAIIVIAIFATPSANFGTADLAFTQASFEESKNLVKEETFNLGTQAWQSTALKDQFIVTRTENDTTLLETKDGPYTLFQQITLGGTEFVDALNILGDISTTTDNATFILALRDKDLQEFYSVTVDPAQPFSFKVPLSDEFKKRVENGTLSAELRFPKFAQFELKNFSVTKLYSKEALGRQLLSSEALSEEVK